MSCFACFTTSFKHYHFENFTFAHSRRNTLDHHQHWSFRNRDSRSVPSRRSSRQTATTRHSRGRTRLSKRGSNVPRLPRFSTIGHQTASSISSVQGPHSIHGPSPLSQEVIYEEAHPVISSILYPTEPPREAPKAPKRVAFAHVTVQRQVTSNYPATQVAYALALFVSLGFC